MTFSKVFGILLLLASVGKAEVVDRIVAVINDSIVTESDITKYQQTLKKGQLVDDLLVTDPQALLKDRSKLIEQLINERIIDSEIKKQGLSVTVEKIEQEIRKISGRNNISRNQLKQALSEQGAGLPL